MKYESINELDHFIFHDAKIRMFDCRSGDIFLTLENLNATTRNSQNEFQLDMCIQDAKIIFEHAKVINIEFSTYESYDADNKLIESVDARKANSYEYKAIIKDIVNQHSRILDIECSPPQKSNFFKACIYIDGGAENYYLTIRFAKSIIMWEKFDRKAWYE